MQASPRGEGHQQKQAIVPRDWSPIQGIDPITGSKCDLYVSARTVRNTADKKGGAPLELAQTVTYTIQHPTAVFRGVTDWDTEDGDEDWLVYCAIPPFAFDLKTGRKLIPAWENEVFLVFVNGDFLIKWWMWEDADELEPRLPVGHDDNRFLEKLL